MAGWAASTTWPSDSSNRAVSSTAVTHEGSTPKADPGASVISPTRSGGPGAPTSSENVPTGGGATTWSPATGPDTQSRSVATSRTDFDTAKWTLKPRRSDPGATDTRPRDTFRPTRPQAEAGMRIDPPPSLAWAMGTIPAATAAHERPLDPPGERARSHGLCVGPNASGSVVALAPTSGVLDLPIETRPAARNRRARCESAGAT